MTPSPGPNRFAVSTRAYGVLLLLLPTAFRRRFAEDLVDDFASLLSEAAAERPVTGRLRCWLEMLLDLALCAPREHWRAFRSPYDARRLAACAHSDHQPTRRPTVRSIFFDLRHAVRALRRSPVYALVTIAILALGIGANTAIFTLVRAVLLRPLPFDEPEQLVLMHESVPAMNFDVFPFSAPDYLDLERQQEVFSEVGVFGIERVEMSGVETPETVDAAKMSASLFATLGVEPALGRVWTSEEDPPGNDVIVLDYDFWQERFAGSPDVLGATVRLDRDPYTVIGVMPASFDFPPRGLAVNGRPADLFRPTAWEPFQLENRGMMHNHTAIGRLADGVTFEQMRANLATIAERIREAYGPAAAGVEVSISSTPLRNAVIGQVRTPLLLLLGAVGLVLLVVVANVANLTLSRAAARQSEMAVRAAIGAGRGRLIQSLLLESLLLAGLGALLGVTLAQLAVRAAIRLLPGAIPFSERVALDLPVLLFTLTLTVATAVLCGAAPLFASGKRRLEALLRSAVGRSTGASAARQRLQRVLVVSTVALALVLLVGAGLLGRSFNRLIGSDAGFDGQRVLTMALTLPPEAYPEAEGVQGFVRTLRERVSALPGVERAALTTALPLTATERRAFAPESATDPEAIRPSVTVTWVDGPFFRALGIPLERGRLFDGSERSDGEHVVLVNHTMAEAIWPGKDPLGERLRWGIEGDGSPWLSVVGVVADVNDGPLGSDPNPHVYVPYAQFSRYELDMGRDLRSPWGRQFQLVIASSTDPTPLINPVLAEVRQLDRSLPVSDVRTMEQIVGDGVAPQRASATLIGAFAGIALLLAGVGLYGVLAYAVTQRRREIGVRVALGAERSSVVGMIVGQGLVLVAVGLAGGLLAALGLSRLMGAVLYQTSTLDPMAFGSATTVLLLAALLASWLPARRASRVDPVTALRNE